MWTRAKNSGFSPLFTASGNKTLCQTAWTCWLERWWKSRQPWDWGSLWGWGTCSALCDVTKVFSFSAHLLNVKQANVVKPIGLIAVVSGGQWQAAHRSSSYKTSVKSIFASQQAFRCNNRVIKKTVASSQTSASWQSWINKTKEAVLVGCKQNKSGGTRSVCRLSSPPLADIQHEAKTNRVWRSLRRGILTNRRCVLLCFLSFAPSLSSQIVLPHWQHNFLTAAPPPPAPPPPPHPASIL